MKSLNFLTSYFILLTLHSASQINLASSPKTFQVIHRSKHINESHCRLHAGHFRFVGCIALASGFNQITFFALEWIWCVASLSGDRYGRYPSHRLK